MTKSSETILASAIFCNGVIHSIPQPGRHHHIIDKMAVNGMRPDQMVTQGFLTSTGRYVDRFEGMKTAQKSGQLNGKSPTIHHELFSEDIW